MYKLPLIIIAVLLINGCSGQAPSGTGGILLATPTSTEQPKATAGRTARPVLPEVDQAAEEQLRTRGNVTVGETACNFGETNPLPDPDLQPLAFAIGTWKVDSSLNASLFGGPDELVETIGIASIEQVETIGFVEYYAGGWDGHVFFDTTFWGAVGSGKRWAVVETNTESHKLNSLQGKFVIEGFSMTGEMFGRRVKLVVASTGNDSFDWKLQNETDGQIIWTKHYTRLNNEAEIAATREYALGGLQSLPATNDLQPIDFWVGEWNWFEHHIDLGRDCAEGQASVIYTNGGYAIEERVISSYDPREAGTETYTDFSLAVFNNETQMFEVYWWTNGAFVASFYQGVCRETDGQKECQLRAVFRPSSDENSIKWEASDGTQIDWERKLN